MAMMGSPRCRLFGHRFMVSFSWPDHTTSTPTTMTWEPCKRCGEARGDARPTACWMKAWWR